MRRTRRDAGTWRRAARRAVFAVLAVTALLAPGHATGATASSDWPASISVRLLDLNADDRVIDPQFSWDPIPNATKYEVEVNSSDQWADGSRVCCTDKSIGTSLSPVKLLPNNTYYWRVRAIDAAGNASPWYAWCGNDVRSCATPVRFEKNFDAVAPTIPGLRVRDNLADNPPPPGPSGLPTTGAPVIAWDPVPGAASYELNIAPWATDGAGYCNWSLAKSFPTATTAWTPLASTGYNPLGSGTPSVSHEIWFLADATSYCVRVRARSDDDAFGADIVSDWTQLGGLGHAAFTYQRPPADPCTATATPADAYHREPSPVAATPRTPLFTWERVPGACGYFVVIAKDAAFTKIADIAFTTIPAYAPRPRTYTDETTSYYWAVMPSVSANGSGVSTQPQEDHPQPFDKRSVPPTLIGPKDGVTGVPSFRWTPAEGARNYRLQVDDDPGFGTPLADVTTASTAYTGTTRYPTNKPLYWRVRANDENGIGLSWSDAGTFTALPPQTDIVTDPLLSGAFVMFEFASDVADASFKCRLDGPGTKVGTLVPCTSPVTYGPLADGTYKFTVVATDLAGNGDSTPATYTFTVDTTAPDTTITSAPPPAIHTRSAALGFKSSETGSTFECRLEGPGLAGAWSACTSPVGYSDLPEGAYTFSVRATDRAGNTDATPATSRFTVDVQAPDTAITSGPGATDTAGTVAFGFAATEPGASFQCRLEGPDGTPGWWAGCRSPMTYGGLAAGAYTFSVRATDAAGNADASPATRTFTLTAVTTPDPPPVIVPLIPPLPLAPPSQPLSPPTQPVSPPTVKHLGTLVFRPAVAAIPVRAGRLRLRFACTQPDGCKAATFRLTRKAKGRVPAIATTVRVKATRLGYRTVSVKLGGAAWRALQRAGRTGLVATVARRGASHGRRVTLVARR